MPCSPPTRHRVMVIRQGSGLCKLASQGTVCLQVMAPFIPAESLLQNRGDQ